MNVYVVFIKIWTLFFLTCIGFFAFFGCGSNSFHQDTVLHAYRLIDTNRSEEAIYLLEKKLLEDPENQELKMTLASAFANRSGVNVQEFIPFAQRVLEFNELQKKSNIDEYPLEVKEKVDSIVFEINRIFRQFSIFFELFESLPEIESENLPYLKHSIRIIGDSEKDLNPSDRMFRVTLNVLFFKHIFSENLLGELFVDKGEESLCRVDISTIDETISLLGNTLINVLYDLTYVRPSFSKDIKKVSKDIVQTMTEVTIFLQSAIILDDISNVFLGQLFIGQGLGKAFKCGN